MPAALLQDIQFQAIPDRLTIRKGDHLHLNGRAYVMESVLGQGGFGTVYRILDEQGRTFALKLLDLWRMKPEEYKPLSARFEQGFKAGKIDSEYLVRNYAFGSLKGNPYIIMDYCPGGSLAARQNEFMDQSRFLPVFRAIILALLDLHNQGIIHRDIKPDNILFDANDRPRLSDFDIAGHLRTRMTQTNWRGTVKEIWGTAVYAPPEQLDAREAFRFTLPSMDIFALGVTAYEILTSGKYPYGSFEEFSRNPAAFYSLVRRGIFTPITDHRPDLDVKLVEAVHRCLIADATKRAQSAEALLTILGETLPERNTSNVHVLHDEWVMRVMNGEETGKEYNLSRIRDSRNRNVLRIGWANGLEPSENELPVREVFTNYISARHATLEWDGRNWAIRDGQWLESEEWKPSLNGTLVNANHVDHIIGLDLRHNDIISIGDTTFKIMHI